MYDAVSMILLDLASITFNGAEQSQAAAMKVISRSLLANA